MQPLKFVRLWLTLGWILIGLVVLFSLLPEPLPIMDMEQGDKAAHLFAYMILMLWFSNIYGRKLLQMWLGIGLLMMGFSLELLQDFSRYRTFQYADLLANGFGVLMGWTLANTLFAHSLLRLDRWLVRVREGIT